ncbi:MAG: hypothetical protein K2X93_29365 [Candidatus Obscuribacterales bacterium]|nr:hypothetical protein [Candidatus Obscuribacterales bacterium]
MNASGSVAMAQGNLKQADNEIIQAAEELVKLDLEPWHPLNELVLSVLGNLLQLDSAQGDKLFDKIVSKHGTFGHRGHRKMIGWSGKARGTKRVESS